MLSFEPQLFEDIVARLRKTNNSHITRYLSSPVVYVLNYYDTPKEILFEEMVFDLLAKLEADLLVELVEHQCTYTWLMENKWRLSSIPEDEWNELLEEARVAQNDFVHTHLPDCPKCKMEEDLSWALFIRRLPAGDDSPEVTPEEVPQVAFGKPSIA